MDFPARIPVDRVMLAAGRVALVAGLSLPLAFATMSFAQPAPQASRSAPPAAKSYHHHGHLDAQEETSAERAARLRAVLQLRPDQEPALTAFLASMTPGPGPKHGDFAAERTLPAPERMERMLARMDEVRAEMSQKLAALKTFYSKLTPAQQKAFDALDLGRGPHHRSMGGGYAGGMSDEHRGEMSGH